MVTGEIIQSRIIISAGCKQKSDHNILGEMALAILEEIGGYIDFGSIINIYRPKIELKGRLFTIGAEGNYVGFHIADKELLRNWLHEGNFSMI